jgi:predicted peptidase
MIAMLMTALTLNFNFATPQDTAAATDDNHHLASGFLYRTLKIGDETYAYSVYVPPEYDPAKKWPMILFLHGSGERGKDGLRQTEVGIGRAIRLRRWRFPAIIVMPQCRLEKTWADKTMARVALGAVEDASRAYHADPDRFYVTGLSLGGAGTWHIAAAIPHKVAAIAPVCGFYDTRAAQRIKDIPTWVFHGSADTAVPVQRSRDMVDAIKNAGGDAQYTEYPGVGHNCWDKAYDNAELWKWMFEQKLSDRAAKKGDAARPEKP